jgi:predicted DsbA family dithiol-disulfide isomerase
MTVATRESTVPGLDAAGTLLYWYDFLCPFCYVAQARNAMLRRQGFQLVELPFQAHPEIPPGGVAAGPRAGPTYAMLEAEAARAGLPLRWPPHLPNTRRALAMAEWTRRLRPEVFPRLREDLFALHFVLNEDLEDLTVLDRCAVRRGLDLAELHAALADGSAEAALAAAEVTAGHYGVRGTPTWVVAPRLGSSGACLSERPDARSNIAPAGGRWHY